MPSFAFRNRRSLILLGSAIACCVAFAAVMLGKDHAGPVEADGSQVGRLTIVVLWGLCLPLVYAWNRYRRRAPYDPEITPGRAAEAFQFKRYRVLFLLALYIGGLLVPMSVLNAFQLTARTTLIDRVFDAMMLLGPCALAIGMITSAIYSKAMGAAVDDELTALHRARAFSFGFGLFLVAGAAALTAAMIQPAWALPAIPIVIGAGVTGVALRFALLERAAQRADD